MKQPSGARTFIIADDLTGACDAAIAFSRRGISTQVVLDVAHAKESQAEVCAICTETRDVPEEQACEVLRHITNQQHIGRYDQIFKKIDSTFRGNTFVEIQAAVEAFPERLVVIAPAYPELGRTSSDGTVHISDIAGKTAVPVRNRLHAIGLHPHWIASSQSADLIRQQMSQALQQGTRTVFCDALTSQHLHAVVQAASALRTSILWIGSAGLAHALAEEIPAEKPHTKDAPPGVLLIFAGSDHPVTQAQLIHLQNQHRTLTLSSSDTQQISAIDISIVILRIERNRTTPEEIRRAVAGFAPQSISCMMMTGGDTAMLVCRALGIRSLCLHQEFEPGLPQGIAVDGSFTGCNIILKSGGFGETGVLSRIATRFTQRKEVIQ